MRIKNKLYLKFIIIFIIGIIAIILYNNFSIIFVKGDSMSPTYQNGSILIINKNYKEINRNDIIVFKKNSYDIYIKRVIGLPNETIYCENRNIYINDISIKDNFGNTTDNFKKVALKNNQYFVVGDNRNKSNDSRTIGFISKKEIIGKIIFQIK